jgi:hypothetical protein
MPKITLIGLFMMLFQLGFSQENNFKSLLDSGKVAFKKENAEQAPDFTKALGLLTRAVSQNPTNTEARYFLGYTIDRINSPDGSSMHLIKSQGTIKASEQFERINSLEEIYTGERWLLDPYTKITTIWGSLAQAYLVRDLPDSARWAFFEGKRRGGFLEPVLHFNRQMLNSCAKNAILVVSGDILTIPIWYMQVIENYRTDITVLNADLLHTSWYPKYLKKKWGLQMSLTDEMIDATTYLKWSEKEVHIINPKDSTESFNWLLKPTYGNQYLLKGDIIFLDILKQNLFKRGIYFSGGSDSSINLFLKEYIIDDGIVDKLLLNKNDLLSPLALVSKNLQAYRMDNLNKQDIKKSQDAIYLLNTYRWSFFGNSNFLYSKGKLKEANALILEMEARFKEALLPFYSENLKENIEKLKLLLQ